MDAAYKTYCDQLLAGDRRALAKLITAIESDHADSLAILETLDSHDRHPWRIGVTGPPGAGKSTLVDKLITAFRSRGQTVGVLAIDPSSPFSGGAVLGDRIRMQNHNADDGVFIRSLGSRGAHGGLSQATFGAALLMGAAGFDVVIVETVGVGQTELDILDLADTNLVVLVPESGDTIQAMKAGIMEIADVFVVNKSDREGADKLVHELRSSVELSHGTWLPPVVKTVAENGSGVADLVLELLKHKAEISKGLSSDQERSKLMRRLVEIATADWRKNLKNNSALIQACEEVLSGQQNLYSAARQLAGRNKS